MAERAGALQDGQSVEVHQLSQRQRQLEARRGSLCARRARLRNLKVGAVALHLKLQLDGLLPFPTYFVSFGTPAWTIISRF